MRRRRFLTATVAGGALLAGCQGGSDDGTGGSDGSDGTGGGNGSDGSTTTESAGSGDGSDASTTTGSAGSGDGSGDDSGTDGGGSGADGSGLPDHEALAGLASQPSLGPEPGTADGLIVAFEDPSCPRCVAFEREVVPQIRSNLVEPGRATFVYRGYPEIYPWGEPATHALEAVYEADQDSFWAVLDQYTAQQGSYHGSEPATVYDMTESFLAEETDLEATAVIDRARNGDVDDRVQVDLDAGHAASVGRVTPHIFMFAAGQFQTKVSGRVDYGIIENVLGT